MEFDDLKKLMTSTPVETKLTPEKVMHYVESKRRGRQRMTAVAAALVLTVGVGAGAMMLNSMTSLPQPQILTTPSPSPVATASPSEVSETLELSDAGVYVPSDATSPIAYPENRCAVNVEDAWPELTQTEDLNDMISLPLLGRLDAQLAIQPRSDGSGIVSLYWNDFANSKLTLITEDALMRERYSYSDGRFVAFSDSQGQVQVWDSENPSVSPRIWSGGPTSNTVNYWELTGGYLWLYEVPGDPTTADSSTVTGNLDLIDLAGGGIRKRVVSDKALGPLYGWAGMLQTHGLDDRGTVMIHPDGQIYTLNEGWSGIRMLGDYGGVQGYQAVNPGSGGASLQSSSWPTKSFDLGRLTEFAQGWAGVEQGEVFNYRTGVTVLMLSNETHSYEFLALEDGQPYVVVTVTTATKTRYRVQNLDLLPTVSC